MYVVDETERLGIIWELQWHVQEFVRGWGGGGKNLKGLFFWLFNFSRGGPSSENSREND